MFLPGGVKAAQCSSLNRAHAVVGHGGGLSTQLNMSRPGNSVGLRLWLDSKLPKWISSKLTEAGRYSLWDSQDLPGCRTPLTGASSDWFHRVTKH